MYYLLYEGTEIFPCDYKTKQEQLGRRRDRIIGDKIVIVSKYLMYGCLVGWVDSDVYDRKVHISIFCQ